MIAVKIWGGLGNQMFQYAFGQYLSKKRNEKVLFYTGKNEKASKLAIDCFKVDIDLLDKKEYKELGIDFSNSLLYRFKRKIFQKFSFLNSKIFVEDDMFFLPNISSKKNIFDGYWQSFKYIEPIEDDLRNYFDFKNNIIQDTPIYHQLIANNSVSLHIRKGDYLVGANAKIYEACSLEYYAKAMQLINDKTSLAVFYVFSNDIEWAKSNLNTPEGITIDFVDNSQTNDPACADLFLMSKCKHHIIANSTFSWWGAWLNSSQEKIVVAPKNWYVGKKNETTVDLIPNDWIRM